MQDLVIKDKYIIGWNPKAGCTMVVKQWFDEAGVLEEALRFSKWVHNFRCVKYYYRFGTAKSEHFKSDDYIKIKYVRNPYDRAVSSYLHGCKYPRLFGCKDISFYEFIKGLREKKISIRGGRMHWYIQWERGKKFDHIIKIENIEEETKRLNEKYDLNLKIFSSSHHHNNKLFEVEDFFLLKLSEVNVWREQNEGVPSYKSFYNDEIRQMVYEIYKVDIDGYNYEFPY